MSGHNTVPQGTRVLCPDCGRPCIVAGSPDEAHQPLTRSNTSEGRCATCALVKWVTETPPLDRLAREQAGVAFRRSHVREAVLKMLAVGNCPIAPAEIDWPVFSERLDEIAAKAAPQVAQYNESLERLKARSAREAAERKAQNAGEETP